MKKFTQIEAMIFVVDKLIHGRYFGAHQLLSDNIVKGKSRSHSKVIKDALQTLIRKGFILTKKKHYGVHISLDPHKIDEIRLFLNELEAK